MKNMQYKVEWIKDGVHKTAQFSMEVNAGSGALIELLYSLMHNPRDRITGINTTDKPSIKISETYEVKSGLSQT